MMNRKVQEVLAQRRRAYLVRLRGDMSKLYMARVAASVPGQLPYVSADDARETFERYDEVPTPQVLSRNFIGAVFRTKAWEPCGSIPSVTRGSHGRAVRRWRLKSARLP